MKNCGNYLNELVRGKEIILEDWFIYVYIFSFLEGNGMYDDLFFLFIVKFISSGFWGEDVKYLVFLE